MKPYIQFQEVMFKSSIWAGILIGLAGWINIASGGGIPGSILFSLGLLTVCLSEAKLFTGISGSIPLDYWNIKDSFKNLGTCLIGNVIGCGIMAALSSGLIDTSEIVAARLSTGLWETFVRAVGCGMLMEIAVWGWKHKSTPLLIFLCVPGFILSGMYHSIADSFYYLSSPSLDCVVGWGITVVGNFIGCEIRRVFVKP